MKNRNRMLLMVVLVFAVILNMATGVLATEQEHDHNWVYQGGGGQRGHKVTCDGCGETELVDHTVDSSGNCTVCSYHIHIWQREWYNDAFHGLVCSGCPEKKTTTHSNDSAGVCTVCGYTPHEHTSQYNGEKYAYTHGVRCTLCAAVGTEEHIYGNDGTCIVCGNAPPHEHEWKWDGKRSSDRNHTLICACGETMLQEHRMAWDGKTRDSKWHKMVCIDCGYSATYGHWFSPMFVNGERCLECGYETVKHNWEYGNYFSENGHDMVCRDCNSNISERHRTNSSGKCTVCGYQVQDATKPESNPDETKPVESTPGETALEETTPAETSPIEADSVETNPSKTQPEETESAEIESIELEPVETKPTESKQAAAETTPQNATKEDSQRSSSVWVWVTAVLVVAGGLGAVLLFLKKKFY